MIHGIRFALVGIALVGFSSAPAGAAMIQVQNCQQVTIEGQTLTRLNRRIAPPPGGSVNFIRVFAGVLPGVSDTCHVVEAIAPPEWTSELLGDGGTYFATIPELGIVYPNTMDGFRLTLSQTRACVRFELSDIELIASAVVCFDGCLATPTRPLTWGGLKAVYR